MSWFVQKVIEMEPFLEACLGENSEGYLLHLALRIKQMPARIWFNHAMEEPERGDGKLVEPEQMTLAKALPSSKETS